MSILALQLRPRHSPGRILHEQRGNVRSEGERLIADWLFLNGADYRYVQPYAHDVADSDDSQYRPLRRLGRGDRAKSIAAAL